MPAPKGNKFWKQRSKHGRDKIFSDKETLWESCCDYFEWVEANPLWEMKVAQYQGQPVEMNMPKMRAMTKAGLCFYLGICENTWDNYKQNKDLLSVITQAELVIREQKFAGAAAELLNPNIIARDLGLADKKDVSNKHSFAEDFLESIKPTAGPPSERDS